MDSDSQSSSVTNNTPSHIYEELYKRNFELATRNKTLSILRKLYGITMSSLEVSQVAQSIVDTLAKEMEFAVVLIDLIDSGGNYIRPIAITLTSEVIEALQLINKPLNELTTSLDNSSNLEVAAVRDGQRKITSNILDILTPLITQETADKMTALTKIKTLIIYPLAIEQTTIGTLIIGISKNEDDLSRAEKETLDEALGLIAISLDRARLHEDLGKANEQLKELDKRKDEFVSVASHELRTPMTAIKSYLWLALSGRGGVVSEKQKYYLDRAYNSTERLIRLVNNLLNVSRIESGRIVLEFTKIDLNKFLQEVISEVKPRGDELKLELRYTPPPSEIFLNVDVDRMKEVVINLIGNSFKFVAPGGFVAISTEMLVDKKIKINVSDNGVGLSEDDLAKLFQKFGLIKESYVVNQNVSQGTGLGLYISKSIVEMHGGEIFAASPGKGLGATFSFTLPIDS